MSDQVGRTCIVGVATGTPDGGVAVLRLSGSNCRAISKPLLGSMPEARFARVRILRDRNGGILDEALVLWMPGPNSFTGEDVLELHIHAGQENVRQVLHRCLELGAVGASAGEFSRRAFENGKLSLEQVEALPSLLGAESELELGRARRLLRGEFGVRLDEICRELFTLQVEVEAHLDFPEDSGNSDVHRWIKSLGEHIDRLEAWSRSHEMQGARNSRFRVVIAGPPNAGKSSLFNALLDRQRSIVSDVAGTTRDFVESSLRLDEGSLDLVDTAGLRDEAGQVEAAGIELGQAEIAGADLVLWVCSDPLVLPNDCSVGLNCEDHRVIQVASKRDLFSGDSDWHSVSVMPGHEQSLVGLRSLMNDAYQRWLGQVDREWIGLDRHADCVRRASIELQTARRLLSADDPSLEIVAFHLGAGAQCLGEIRGRDAARPVGEEVLNAIFSTFCIGK